MTPMWIWAVTIAVVVVVYTIETIWAFKHPHEIPMKEAAFWISFYFVAAMLFAASLWFWRGHDIGIEFVAGYITELSLSVDNLFVFIIIMASFSVPSIYQQTLLQMGIVGALILRFAFILAGAAAIERYSWMFYIFGAFLLLTAIKLLRQKHNLAEMPKSNLIIWLEKLIPLTSEYHGNKFKVKIDGKLMFTPMVIVIISIFMTDLIFALDSIPAIYGLTKDPYIVFTANAFALMGLRQMYFLLGGLLTRLVYLSFGLAFILAFIGVKLLLHAHKEAGFNVPEIDTFVSLGVIITTLIIAVGLSLRATRDKQPMPVGIGEGLDQIAENKREKH